jgi:hypothetical protein
VQGIAIFNRPAGVIVAGIILAVVLARLIVLRFRKR